MKQKVIDYIARHKIIAIVRGLPREKIIPTAQALYDGGIRLIEVTFNQASKNAMEETPEAIRALCETFGDELYVGAGTVITVKQVEAAKNAGAKYIISPNTDIDVIHACNKMDLVSIPGAFTPSEISLAFKSGADLIKLFPAISLGFDYIKAIRAPLNHIPMLAVGGVNESNINKFLQLGLLGVGVGSNIVKTDLIMEGSFDEIKALAEIYTRAIAKR
ncbi:MAG: bifunctional 4-hydroxy-2-oxoglutarate aldolase/2-dehydro-3-deoxy-phosphogluconate aldolase [Bacillota bacterium]